MSSGTSYQAPRGMRDFYPADVAARNRVFDAWRRASRLFGFEEYDACVVETLDLLKRKAGEEIVEQIYSFRDKSGRDLALRPEMTPTLARMVAARQGSLSFPVKWFTVAQCFRYERTTKGRKREHYQWNLDILGEDAVTAEAEVVAAAVTSLSLMGLDRNTFRVFYSSRALLTDLLQKAGIPLEHHPATFLALDKQGKVPEEAIREMLAEAGVTTSAADRVLDILQIDSLAAVEDALGAPTESLDRLNAFAAELDRLGCADTAVFDLSVVRGLTYYTGIVFEAYDRDRRFRAIFGGGRYDNLLADIGGAPLTGVGLGFGDVVVGDMIENAGISPANEGRADIGIGYMEDAQRDFAVRAAISFREQDCPVDLALSPERAKHFFSRCDKAGFREAAYIGPDDVTAGTLRVKNMTTGEERVVGLGRA